MSDSQSNNKRIAKNTIMLYIRMSLSIMVSLYTSRVVLQTLGVEDYGIFGVVGGVVSMMGFLNASLSGATSRFITFELGRGDISRVKNTFSTAFIIHIIIALIVVLLAETIGLWFLCNKLVIPEDRMIAAHWVYQCSIISAAIGITQTPYSAVIMSREKMDIYAYMELLNVSLKLGIVYLLVIGDFDKLILYSILTLGVSFLMCMLYRIYCIKKFEESHFLWLWNKELLKPMMFFSGWNLYESFSFSFLQQGRSFVVNYFWGVLLNAACGVAATVQSVFQMFSGNIVQAFRPQIIKNYASRDFDRMLALLINGAKYSYLLLCLVVVPCFFEMDDLLELWLGEVPVYSTIFCRVLLVQSALNVFNTYLIIAIQATGNVKRFVYSGTVSIAQVPLLYILFKFFSIPADYIYHVAILCSLINLIIYFYIVSKQIPEITILKYFISMIKTILISVICAGVLYLFHIELYNPIINICISGISFFLVLMLLSAFFLLNKEELRTIKSYLLRKS